MSDTPLMVTPGVHLKPTAEAAGVTPGVYRVVGQRPETVTLLRVGDAAGRRVHTGETVTVPRGRLSGFERRRAPEPPELLGALWSQLPFVSRR